MLMEFKQATHIAGKDYTRGIHDVPESDLKDAHLLNYIKLGLIIDSKELVQAPTEEERQKALAAKVLAFQKAPGKAAIDEEMKSSSEKMKKGQKK